MILVTKRGHNNDSTNDKPTLSSSKIVSTFLRRSKRSNIVNRIKKIKFFQKTSGKLIRKKKALGRKQFQTEKDLYMKTHRFSKYGF